MKISDEEAHVSLGDYEVRVGDRVSLYTNRCTDLGQAGRYCEKVPTGGGRVTEILNKHYSVVTMDPGVTFSEGSLVEKE